MAGGRRLGRRFGWLWAAYGTSVIGTWLAFDAFPLIAITVLHVGPGAVSAMAAAGLAAGAMVALPLGPWVEFRRKRPVMMAMDLTRFVAVLSVPVAYALGRLGFGQLLVVSTVVAAADIAFTAAAGAFLKGLLGGPDLLCANARFEATTWLATTVSPPLGGAAIAAFGPVTTVLANATSYLLSTLGLWAVGAGEPPPARPTNPRGGGELTEGWRHLLTHPQLRPLFVNVALFNGLIMATAPVIAVLMLGDLGFAPWQYGLAFAAPCVGGLVGSRLARPLVARHGCLRVLRVAGTARACWLLPLAFVRPGAGGLLLVMSAQLGVVTCAAVFNPVLVTYRLEHTGAARVARTLAAWSVGVKITVAALTALWGAFAAMAGPRAAIAAAGVLMLASPLPLTIVRDRATAGAEPTRLSSPTPHQPALPNSRAVR